MVRRLGLVKSAGAFVKGTFNGNPMLEVARSILSDDSIDVDAKELVIARMNPQKALLFLLEGQNENIQLQLLKKALNDRSSGVCEAILSSSNVTCPKTQERAALLLFEISIETGSPSRFIAANVVDLLKKEKHLVHEAKDILVSIVVNAGDSDFAINYEIYQLLWSGKTFSEKAEILLVGLVNKESDHPFRLLTEGRIHSIGAKNLCAHKVALGRPASYSYQILMIPGLITDYSTRLLLARRVFSEGSVDESRAISHEFDPDSTIHVR